MCGIVGLKADASLTIEAERSVAAMADRLTHRGPDGSGSWSDTAAGISFGHRRLAVIDLTPSGHQPMVSANGRFVLSYNGEIYGGDAIRADLPQISFRGNSDTETILEACAAWGFERTLPRLVGMFAFALWDRETRTLILARDRLGIKPLYWTKQVDGFLFASELKAFRAWPGFAPEINRDALASYFRATYIAEPDSIFCGVNKLPPGHILRLKPGAPPEIAPFWRLRDAAVAGRANRSTDDPAATVERLDALLGDAVEKCMIADVPLGAFLSGGIDSSLVVALMQARSARPVRTFTMAFDQPGYDESDHARAIAHHLGTKHTELPVRAHEALDLIPRLADLYDEPFADSSQIPTYLVSRLAREHVTVALSGDGGDELFDGYERYRWTRHLWSRTAWLPASLRSAIARVGRGVPLTGAPGVQRDKLAEILECRTADALFRRTASSWQSADILVRGAKRARSVFDDPDLATDLPDLQDRMQYLDGVTHLSDDVLTKVDRASMAMSLEVRVPLLDHRVAEFAFRIPPHMRRHDGKGKWPLRQVLKRYVPERLFDRPKMGFMVPLGRWLRTDLRDWAEALLDPSRLEDGGYLNAAPIRARWREHLAGTRDWSSQLWTVLMFQTWRARWMA
jgi:asparagine synthase (glutamine-hydrolysing)